MPKEKDYFEILLEDINSKFDFIVETVGSMKTGVAKLPKIEEKIEKLESDMATVKLATRQTNFDVKDIKDRVNKIDRQLDELEQRLTTVETRA